MNLNLSERARANIERQTRRLCVSDGSELNQPAGENVRTKTTKSRAELNIERQTARLKGMS